MAVPHQKVRRPLRQDERGAVYVEFLLVFGPYMMMFLGLMQLALLYADSLVVMRAASTAARAAIVVLDDDPAKYEGEPRMQLRGAGVSDPESSGGNGSRSGNKSSGSGGNKNKNRSGSRSAGNNSRSSGGQRSSGQGQSQLDLVKFLGSYGGDTGGDWSGVTMNSGENQGSSEDQEEDGARMSAIRSAAGFPLMAIAPPLSILTTKENEEGLLRAVGDRGMSAPITRLASGILFNDSAMAVVFPTRSGSRLFRRNRWCRNPPGKGRPPTTVRVRVSYLAHCGVPLVNRLICLDAVAIATDNAQASAALFSVRSGIRDGATAAAVQAAQAQGAQRTLDAAALAISDLRKTRQSGLNMLAALSAASGVGTGVLPRFRPMSAEAELPIQYSNYLYTEDEDVPETMEDCDP